MAPRTDSFDLGRLRLTTGEGRRLELEVALDSLLFGGETYSAAPNAVDAILDISRTTHHGYALRLRFDASLQGPCMRCLEPARPEISVDSREVDQPGDVEELSALALALPAQLLCRAECAGLCAICGTDLNAVGPEHAHEREPDPRWAKLGEIRFE